MVVGDRQHRPLLPPSGCPFCPGGLEAPAPYRVRWFANRWPAMPDERCEVVLYSPDHRASLATLGPAGCAGVVQLWAERTVALGSRPDVAYVLVFENRGPAVGATIDHPHGQIYAYPSVPPVPARELDASACALCRPPGGELTVFSAGGWRAWAQPAPTWPYELLIAPADHLPDLPAAASTGADLGAVLSSVVARLDGLFGEAMPYMLWVHQRPTDGGRWPTAHVHVHVAPFLRAPGVPRYVAAAELGGGVMFNPVDPATAAARLREAAT